MKIYIVDDASFIRIICRYNLEKAGHKIVGESYEGDTALAEILSIQPDCVLMDMALPNKNGAEIIKEVQPQYPHIKFIIVSALDEDFIRNIHPDLNYSDYVRKPFVAQELLEKVKQIEMNMEIKKHG